MDDLKLIKKHYGEKMMHLCREIFPTILETPGLLFTVLSNTFAYSKFLYDDIVNNSYIDEFKNFIYELSYIQQETKESNNKTPQELLAEAGYNLYECHSEEDIQSFKKYYAKGEALCTFLGGRLNRCHVFFAVKKNIDDIKREDFPNPERQDEYGTSIISIQFTRGDINTLSIKNRYNHTVRNPDATFGNNLENIIPGLTDAFEKKYNLQINSAKSSFELDDYIYTRDHKYYKFNYEVLTNYYCPNNVVIEDYQAKQYDTSRYIVFEHFILDMQEKRLYTLEDGFDDSFIDGFNDKTINYETGEKTYTSNIKSIRVENNKETNEKTIIINDDIIIVLNKYSQIIKYKNPHIKEVGYGFLGLNNTLEELDLPNVKKIDEYFLARNKTLKRIDISNVEEIGDSFLRVNEILEEIKLPKCKYIGDTFLEENKGIKEIDLPEVLEIGQSFLYNNEILERITAPKVWKIGSTFLCFNTNIKEIDFPELIELGSSFMYNNRYNIKKISFPKLKIVGAYFLYINENLEELDLPEVEKIEYGFLYHNLELRKLNIPKCKIIRSEFLQINNSLEELDLPNVEEIGDSFLRFNHKLRKINTPNLRKIGDYFLTENTELEELNIPKVEKIGWAALEKNKKLTVVFAPALIMLTANGQTNRLIQEAIEKNCSVGVNESQEQSTK